jgi:predicted Fe-Mo cluster-binding NifX family protein
MKIAVSSTGKNLDSLIDQRFGRCAYFAIVETEDMSFQIVDNESASLGGGAGIQSAQFVAAQGAKFVITGNCGPNAINTLSAAGVKLITGQAGIIKDAVTRFKNGKLELSKEANVPEFYGVGSVGPDGRIQSQPVGSGRGKGGGGGMGGGRGCGIGRGMGGGKGKGGGRGMGGGGKGFGK